MSYGWAQESSNMLKISNWEHSTRSKILTKFIETLAQRNFYALRNFYLKIKTRVQTVSSTQIFYKPSNTSSVQSLLNNSKILNLSRKGNNSTPFGIFKLNRKFQRKEKFPNTPSKFLGSTEFSFSTENSLTREISRNFEISPINRIFVSTENSDGREISRTLETSLRWRALSLKGGISLIYLN